jgi:acyl carrier protein
VGAIRATFYAHETCGRPPDTGTDRALAEARDPLPHLAKESISMNDIGWSLRQFIKENFLFGQDLTFADDDSFLELGIVDSTGVLELVTFIEERYQITVDDEELVPENLDSIENLVRFIEARCSCSSVPS